MFVANQNMLEPAASEMIQLGCRSSRMLVKHHVYADAFRSARK